MGDPITVRKLAQEIYEFYKIHPVGGPFHIVLDDFNLATNHVQWCLDNLDDWFAKWYDDPRGEHPLTPELIKSARTLGQRLLQASLTQRSKAIYLADKWI